MLRLPRLPCTRSPAPPALSLRRHLTVLALESSADDTCAAVVSDDRTVLSNVVISQQAS